MSQAKYCRECFYFIVWAILYLEMILLQRIDITGNEAGQRLDRFLRKLYKDTPLSQIYKMLRKKLVKVNGKGSKEDYRLSLGDVVEIYSIEVSTEKETVKKADRDFEIIYEDDNILIVDKPAGLILHPDKGHTENTLVDQVLYYLYQKNEYVPEKEVTFKPAAVNRLDLNTAGLVMFAKNYNSLKELSQMVRERSLEKYYICMVKGKMDKDLDMISYLLKDNKSNKVSIFKEYQRGCKKIETSFMPVKTTGRYSLVEVDLITGRSHQIRAQLLNIGHPIIGDIKYGDNNENMFFKNRYGLKNQFLFSYRIHFNKAPGKLSYLDGREFKSKLPSMYVNIINDCFGIMKGDIPG